MHISARHLASLLFLLIALLAAVWGSQRVAGTGGAGSVSVAVEANLESYLERDPAPATPLVCAYDPAAVGALLTPAAVRAWRAAPPLGGAYGTLGLPMASLWTLFGALGLAGLGHALAVGGLSILNPRFVAIAWWSLLPEMFLADGGWFGPLSAGRLWPMLGGIGMIARLRPWGRRAQICAPAIAAPRHRFLNRKTVVAGGVCWLTAFGVFAAVYPNLSAKGPAADAAAQTVSNAVRQARGQGDFVAENAGNPVLPETSPQLAAAPELPPAPPAVSESAAVEPVETASAPRSGGALPRFAAPSATARGGKSGESPATASGGQPATAPSTPTVELALAQTAPSLPALPSPWMPMNHSSTRPRTMAPETPSDANTGSDPDARPGTETSAEANAPAAPLEVVDARVPIATMPIIDQDQPLPPNADLGPNEMPPPPPLDKDPEGPETPPDPKPVPGGGKEITAPQQPVQVPEPGMLGLFALGVIGVARLRRRA